GRLVVPLVEQTIEGLKNERPIPLRYRLSHSFEPPSTGMLAPVIHRAPSDARNAITSATSDGCPMRLSACIPRVKPRPASVFVKWDISVSITPGATALTRIPRGPRVDAQCLTSVSSAPFVAA